MDAAAGSFNFFCALLRRLFPTLKRRASIDGALEHLASLPLTAQSCLALVRLHQETLLLGITPQSITLLSHGRQATLNGTTIAPDSVIGADDAQTLAPKVGL
jgi:flagellar biogenesis protein FliO